MSALAILQNSMHLNDDYEPLNDPQYLRDIALEELEPPLTPDHPDWYPTVYYDPARFPVEAAFERIARHYAAATRGRDCRVNIPGHDYRLEALPISELKRFARLKYPRAEETFRRRGFVSDLEVRSFESGDNTLETTYLMHNRAAASSQLSMIEAFIQPPRATSQRGEARRIANLGRLFGRQQLEQKANAPVPLIERDGIFLPCTKFWKAEQVHFAYAAALTPTLKEARHDPAGNYGAMSDELQDQVQFERRNTRYLFNGASAFALLLWQTQALAMLRKAAWQIEFFAGAALSKQETIEAERRASALQRLRNNPSLINPVALGAGFDAAFANYRNRMHTQVLDVIADEPSPRSYGVAFGLTDYTYGLRTEELVVAALHGSTYNLDIDPEDPFDRMEPSQWLQPVAEWIGGLKRHRHALLDERVASLLLSVFNDDNEEDPFDPKLSRFASVIQDRLGAVAWNVIAAAILDMRRVGTSETISVLYEWTRSPAAPWAAERRSDGTIAICGPLLDFPVSQAAYWNTKSRIVREEGGLVFRRDRRG